MSIALSAAVLVMMLDFGSRSRLRATSPPGFLRLADAVQIYYTAGTHVRAAPTYPKKHEISVDGELFVRQPATERPLTIRTPSLVLKAFGPAELRIIARSNETGEEVEVLVGSVEARKAYRSTRPAPAILDSGDVSMVNRSIDFMEKGRTDPGRLRAWRDALITSMHSDPNQTVR